MPPRRRTTATATDNIVNAGDRADHLVVVLGGLAYQYKTAAG
jgi:hypothetical protein